MSVLRRSRPCYRIRTPIYHSRLHGLTTIVLRLHQASDNLCKHIPLASLQVFLIWNWTWSTNIQLRKCTILGRVLNLLNFYILYDSHDIYGVKSYISICMYVCLILFFFVVRQTFVAVPVLEFSAYVTRGLGSIVE